MRLIECLGKKAKDSKDAWKILMNTPASEIIQAQKKMNIGDVCTRFLTQKQMNAFVFSNHCNNNETFTGGL